MVINHIILPGGGPIGIFVYGALKRLNKLNFWNIENIKSIYCTSIGGLIGIITILNLDWEWMDDFLIKRPWNKIIDLNNVNYLEIISEKGLFNENIAKNIIEPLLKAKGLDINITLQDFYKITNISIHFYSTNINSNLLDEEEISYKNFPNMKLYEALYATMNVPFIFKPYYIDNKCLIDGGLVNNNPIKNCVERENVQNENYIYDNILFFTNSTRCKENKLAAESNIFDLLLLMLSKMATTIMCRNIDLKKNKNIKNLIECDTNNGSLNIEYWLKVLNSQEEREKILNNGIIKANEFILDNYINFINIDVSNNNNISDYNDISYSNIVDISNVSINDNFN